MKNLEVKIKKLRDDAVIPTYGTDGAAGLDITFIDVEQDEFGCLVYKTGLAIEIPEGYAGFLFPRSSIYKKDLLLTNCIGVIDSDYRGEFTLKFKRILNLERTTKEADTYNIGERGAQLIIMEVPNVMLKIVDELSMTKRGTGGYGHTGK